MCGRKPILIQILCPKVKLFKTDGNTQWLLFNSTVWLIWKKVSCGTSRQAAKLIMPEFSASQLTLISEQVRSTLSSSSPSLAPEHKAWFWRVSLRHVWKTCHHLKGERKAISSARCIFHKLNENWSTWRNKLVSLLPRCGIENKAQDGTKSDQSDGTPALLAKPPVCAKHRGKESRWHPLHSRNANWACKCQMATAVWYERAPH